MTESVSIILPAFNEEKNIEKCIREITLFLEKEAIYDYELIIVNDGSTDKTKNIIKVLLSANPRIILIDKRQREGYGASIRSGIKASTKRLIFYTDSDLQYDIRDLRYFLDAIDDADYVIGYRILDCIGFIPKILVLFKEWGIRHSMRLSFRDTGCSFKLFHADIIQSVITYANGFTYDIELLLKLQKKGYNAKELPVSYYRRKYDRSFFSRRKSLLRLIIDLTKLKLNILHD